MKRFTVTATLHDKGCSTHVNMSETELTAHEFASLTSSIVATIRDMVTTYAKRNSPDHWQAAVDEVMNKNRNVRFMKTNMFQDDNTPRP